MGAIMSVAMGSMMSLVVTYLNLGLVDDFVQRWLVAFVGVLPIGFPVSIVVTPIVKAFIDRITE